MNIRIEPLPAGVAGTRRTLEVMAELVRKDRDSAFVRKLRWLLHERTLGRGQIAFVCAAFFVARDWVRYMDDPDPFEKIADIQRILEAGVGDCDEKVIVICTLLHAESIPCRFRVQSYDGKEFHHVYCEAQLEDGTWLSLDPTADGHRGVVVAEPGWRQPLPAGGFEETFPI